jgi:chromate transporter
VGVVLNLAVWFGMHVLWPEGAAFNIFGAVVGLAAFVALQFFSLSIVVVILASGALGFFRLLIASW